MAVTDIDEAKLEAFVGHVATELGAAVNAALVLIGDELGLFRAMADGQPVSPQELAARKLLHVPETAPDLGDAARRTCNKGAASRVRRTPVHLERGIEAMEPQAHGRR